MGGKKGYEYYGGPDAFMKGGFDPAMKGKKKLYINGQPIQNLAKKGYFHLKDFPAGKTSFEVK